MPLINNLYFKFRNFLSHRFPKLYCFCDFRKSIVKFFISGCLGGGADLVFLFVFHSLFNLGIVVSSSLAFILSFALIFTLQKIWTFRDHRQDKTFNQLILYFLNVFICLSVNGFLMHYLVNGIDIWYMLSQLIVNCLIGIYNFIVYKFIIFRKGNYEIDCQEKSIS